MVPGTGYLSQIVLGPFWQFTKQIGAILAHIYLWPPAFSVPSERLLSTAGDVVTEHRARLLPDNAERLIFLKYNASLIKPE